MGGSWVNILIFVLVIGAPAIGSIWKKLEEKKEQRRIETHRERLQVDQLRTGRVQPTQQVQQLQPEATRSASTGDIDAQRRARLEELRRRQQERLRQAAQARPQPSTGQVRAISAPGGVQSPGRGVARPGQPPARPVRAAPMRAPLPSRSAQRPQPPRAAPPRPAPVRSQPVGRSKGAPLPSSVSNLELDSRRVTLSKPMEQASDHATLSSAQTGASRAKLFGHARPTVADLRRAVLLREIFDRPVSMRDQPPGSL